MADANNQTNTSALSEQEIFSQIAEGKMTLSDVPSITETPEAEKETSSDPALPSDSEENAEDKEPQKEEVEPETLESYKTRAEKEIATWSKRAKDNQAAFTNKSKELADALKAKKELEDRVAELESKSTAANELDLSAFEEYPQEIKDVISGLYERNNALLSKIKEIDSFVTKEKGERQIAEEQKRQAEEIRQDFATNILPKIEAEIPDYDSFMRANMGKYVEWTKGLSEGERFSFLNSKDPRDLIRGCKEFKKFLNLPYEKEAVNQEKTENKNIESLYSSKQTAKRTIAPKETEPWNAEKAWKEQQKKNEALYNNLTLRR